jgi:hypothetical protein
LPTISLRWIVAWAGLKFARRLRSARRFAIIVLVTTSQAHAVKFLTSLAEFSGASVRFRTFPAAAWYCTDAAKAAITYVHSDELK